ncbi:MAG: hypothetical protein LBS21_10795 [Clostridiales bacterium]|jgi:hypothetical protein|nr:hypothetical protein [Clostridiales bacterium]
MTKKKKKILLHIIIFTLIFLLSLRVNQYQSGCYDARDMAGHEGGFLELNLDAFSRIIPYDILSSKYKRSVSREEYENAKTDEQLFNVFLKMDSVKRSKNASRFLEMSTTRYKGFPCDFMDYNGKTYWVTLEIDFRPNLLTLEPEVSRFAMIIEEKQRPSYR